MTVYRVRLYGEVILTVTSEYHQQRMEHLASQTEAARSAASEYYKQCCCRAVNISFGSAEP
jgi:hypothetical protein